MQDCGKILFFLQKNKKMRAISKRLCYNNSVAKRKSADAISECGSAW